MEFEYNVKINCTCCNKETLCREYVIEIEEGQKLLFFCKSCDEDIQDLLDYFNN